MTNTLSQIQPPNNIPNEFRRAHILIVDDDPTNRVLLHSVCDKLGIGIIDEAEDGVEALDLITRFKPDMVLLDIKMPRMDGMELMRRLRSNSDFDYLAILVQTGLQSHEDRLSCFSFGATDVVSRPFHLPELKARICAHLRSSIAARVLFDFRNRIQAHIEITHNFLGSILPSIDQIDSASSQYGLDLSFTYRPHDEIGGDLWVLRPLDNDRIAILLIDASAHGLAGAINALRVDCLVQVFHEFLSDPAQFLNRLDAAMAKISFGQLFAGAVAIVYNKSDNKILFAGSGNPSPILYRNREVMRLKTSGMILGSGLLNLTTQEATLEHDDKLIIFSDGWSDGSQDEIDKKNIPATINMATASLADSLTSSHSATDDLTLITVQRRLRHAL